MSEASKSTIIGWSLPNIPWEEKPKGHDKPVWRFSKNPVIKRDAIPFSNSIFSSAVISYKNK